MKFFPKFPSKTDSGKYSLFCKYQLIRVKPWALDIHNVWDNKVDTCSTYAEEWKKFLSKEYAKGTVFYWRGQMDLIEDQIACHATLSSDSAGNAAQEQEVWMQVAPLVQHSIDETSEL